MARVAIFTFGILREAEGHPQVQGFFDRDPHVFAAVEKSAGFIAYSGYAADAGLPGWGKHVYPRFFTGDPDAGTPATLSLWQDLESVLAFAYSGIHAEALSHRREWFVKPQWPGYVLWWVGDNDIPQWAQAVERHEYLHDHGPGAYAFDFRHPFGADGRPVHIDRTQIKKF